MSIAATLNAAQLIFSLFLLSSDRLKCFTEENKYFYIVK